jgi:SAM-dependent methyltransferase
MSDNPDTPLVWHFGLMAERWAEFIQETPQLPFFKQEIARFGQPVLDLACGAGRLLLPLLREGIDIDGCDLSEDMLSHCRAKAAAEGYTPNLYSQPMNAFSLPRKYRTIYICDSFGLAGSRANDLETLRRCYVHLEEGGALLVNIDAEYANSANWQEWLKEFRDKLPEPWPEPGARQVAADGSEHLARFRTLDVDPLEQTFTRQVRLDKWVGGELVASQEYTLRGDTYFKHELLLMLKVAGFTQVTVRGDYSDETATADHKELIFTARR